MDTFRGYLSVQTGIDGSNRDQVFTLIEQQLQSLQRGEITEAELAQTKAMLKNQFLLSLDSPQSLIETEYLNQWVPNTKMSEEQFIQRLEEVSVTDVQKLLKRSNFKPYSF